MNTTLAIVLVVALLAVVVFATVLFSRGRFRGEVRGPSGMGATVEGDRSKSGVRARNIRAGRNVKAHGSSVDARNVKADQDVDLKETRADPQQGNVSSLEEPPKD